MSEILESLQDSIEKEIQKNKMKIAEENFIYDISNNKHIEKSTQSKEMEKHAEKLIKLMQDNVDNTDKLKKVLEENNRLKEELAKSKRYDIKINSEDDIETNKDI